MNKKLAVKLASEAVKYVDPKHPIDVYDCVVLYQNEDGSYAVCDNGEEIPCFSRIDAERMIVANLLHK